MAGVTAPAACGGASPPEIASDDLVVDLGSILGSGSYGGVFAGTLPADRAVACKSFHFIRDPLMWEMCFGASSVGGAENWVRFLRDIHGELEAMAALRHPRLVALRGVVWSPEHAVVVDGGALLRAPQYIVMERATMSLERRLVDAASGASPLTPHSALRWLADAAEGLAVIHRRGYLHRDIKPANLLLLADASGAVRLKLADLGLARSVRATARGLTRGAGTLAYMAPEVARAGGEYGPKADVFALGRVACELLAVCRVDAAAAVMQPCLSDAPEERPAASVLLGELTAILVWCVRVCPCVCVCVCVNASVCVCQWRWTCIAYCSVRVVCLRV